MDQRFRQDLAPEYASLAGFVASLPELFEHGEGEVIYDGRNQLRRFFVEGQRLIVKSFRVPNWVNRIAYGWLRASKAERSFTYAARLRALGIGSPAPVGWLTERSGLLFGRSYYVSLESRLPYTYKAIMDGALPSDLEERALKAIGAVTARLHNHGMLHKDYSRGNILFGPAPDGSVEVELIDLNRLRFGRVSFSAGLANLFERLPATPEQHAILECAYREARSRVES